MHILKMYLKRLCSLVPSLSLQIFIACSTKNLIFVLKMTKRSVFVLQTTKSSIFVLQTTKSLIFVTASHQKLEAETELPKHDGLSESDALEEGANFRGVATIALHGNRQPD